MINHRIKAPLVLILVFLMPHFVMAWNAVGHMIVAQIAYDNMNQQAKRRANQLLRKYPDIYPRSRSFVKAALWADTLKLRNIKTYNNWHFISLPYSDGKTSLPRYRSHNLVWALNRSIRILKSKHSSEFTKAKYLRFLIHLVGDAHQPLHCINRVSQGLPNGDQGGNLFPINSPVASDLHSFWDRGLGFFQQSYPNHRLRPWQIRNLARSIEDKYPKQYFGREIYDLNPKDWVQHCYDVAKNFAYKIRPNEKPPMSYINRGKLIVQSQLALAGYRLAKVLNTILN